MDIISCQANHSQSMIEEESQIQMNKISLADEYPVIWYESDIDSEEERILKALIQEDSKIHLFSKFTEVFRTAQSLGSFLLITSSEINQEKLFQRFKGLEDTYGRRYYDFEEKAVLKSLLKEISEDRIKSLKVFLFCTRKDLVKESPVNEEEEEVTIMCDFKEMAKQFREESTIIWCDPDSNQAEKRTLIKQFDIEEKNIFPNFEDLLKRLNSYSGLPYHLILSGKNQAELELVIKSLDSFKDLLCVYIYENPPLNGKKGRKIEMEKTLEGLIPKIIQGVRTKSVYKNTFPAFATQFDDWDKSYINKVHYYLKGFVNFKNRRQAKQDFINLAKKIYQSQKLLEFEREYFEYSKEQILKWYSSQSPIYKLINNCLRISTSDSILHCRFVLKDLERAIKEEYQQQNNKYTGVVYRGAYISKDEFDKLGKNIGKEIEMYGFLSTSMDQKNAENFMCDDIKNKVFITIIIPPILSPELDEQGFANLSKYSKFSEQEILFNVRSRFQVLEVGSIKLGKNNHECRHLVLLYGAQLLRKYMTRVNPTISLIFDLPLEFKCNYCPSKQNLLAYREEIGETKMICGGCLTPSNFVAKSAFLLPIDEKVELAGERRFKVEGRVLELGVEAKLSYARIYKCCECFRLGGDFCQWINLEDGIITLHCFECFKKTQERKINHLLLFEGSTQVFWSNKQGKWEEREMKWKAGESKDFDAHFGGDIFEKAHDYIQCQQFYRTILQSTVRKMGRERAKKVSYLKLGESLRNIGEYKKALEYLLRVQDIEKFLFRECHPDNASLKNSIGLVYKSLEEPKAHEYFLEALKIGGFIDKESHPHVASSYNNIASVHHSLGENQKALGYYLKALEIRKSIYGESHPLTAISYNNLASVYSSLGIYQQALEYHLKALETHKSIFGESHPLTATSYNNLASVEKDMGKYQIALEYHQKALKIVRSIYGKFHPHIASSYDNLATVYESLGKHQIALRYYLRAFEIRKSVYGESHLDIASSYNNLGLLYQSLGEHNKALGYQCKALEIRKSIYGESHPDIVTSYTNLAPVFGSLGDNEKALEYYQKSLDMSKSIYGESHPDTASSYNNLGEVYQSLGKYEKALEYFLKALEIQKPIYKESHPRMASSYNNIAFAYGGLNQDQNALKYHLKALKIRKFIYKEPHSETATSCFGLGLVYCRLKEHQKALEYHQKALEIRESIHKKLHSDTATSYNELGLVYYTLEEDQKALECHLKALEIREFISGESHPDTVTSYFNLGLVSHRLGEHQKVLAFSLKVLAIRKSIDEESPSYAAALYYRIAIAYDGLEEDEKALEYHQKALKIREFLYRDSHPDVATSYNSLGLVYYSLKEYQEAHVHYLKALEIREHINEEPHPETATSYFGLGSMYYRLKEYQESLKYHLKALEIRKSIYEEFHLDTAFSYFKVASVYESLGNRKQALEYHLKALEIQKSISEAFDPNTAFSYYHLASVYESLGEYQRALEYHWEALKIREFLHGESHSDTATSYSGLASVYKSLGEHEKALEYHQKAFQIENSHSHLSNNDLVLEDSLQELLLASCRGLDVNNQASVPSASVEVEELSHSDDRKNFENRSLPTETHLIANSVSHTEASGILGKRKPSKNDDEEKFEPNIEKKFKQ